jgi:hypothetical protein
MHPIRPRQESAQTNNGRARSGVRCSWQSPSDWRLPRVPSRRFLMRRRRKPSSRRSLGGQAIAADPIALPGTGTPSAGDARVETPRAGLEPATCRLEGDCSFQLSYRGKIVEIIPQSRRGWVGTRVGTKSGESCPFSSSPVAAKSIHLQAKRIPERPLKLLSKTESVPSKPMVAGSNPAGGVEVNHYAAGLW